MDYNSGDKNQKRMQAQGSAAFRVILLACCVLLAGSYVFLNLARFTAQMDSDIAAEALNARAIWLHKSVIPTSFYPSTERRILNVNLIGALLYGLTGNMNLSMGIACCLMMVLLLVLYGLLLRRLGFGRVALWAGLTVLLAIPGSMRHSQLLYLYAVYYAVHCICMLITLLILLDISDRISNCISDRTSAPESGFGAREGVDRSGAKVLWVKAAAAVVLAFLISLSGLRAALICYAPLAAAEVLRLVWERLTGGRIYSGAVAVREQEKTKSAYPMKEGGALKRQTADHNAADRQRRSELWRAFYAILLVAASFAGSRMPTAVGVETSRNLRGGFSKLLHTVVPDLISNVYCENQSLPRTILLAVLLLAAVGVTVKWGIVSVRATGTFVRKCSDKSSPLGYGTGDVAEGGVENAAENKHCQEKERAFILGFFWISLLLSVVMGAFTTTDSVWRYYFMLYFVLSFGAACLMQDATEWRKRGDTRRQKGRLLECMLAGGIAVLSLLVWREELWPSMRQSSGNAEYESIVQWMLEQDCYYGYSTYDSANAITGACNGAVQVSAVADLGTLDICKWLTDSDWYVPSLPEEMRTAYIVPKSLEESFLPNTEQHADITEGLETENYTVYIAEHNYTRSNSADES